MSEFRHVNRLAGPRIRAGRRLSVYLLAATALPLAAPAAASAQVARPQVDSAYMLLQPQKTVEIVPGPVGIDCLEYPGYVVVAWKSPNPAPVAIIRKRNPDVLVAASDCVTDSLPGDYVVRTKWAEYFYGLWKDLLFLDSGTSQLSDLLVYDVPSRQKVLTLAGAEMDGLIDSVTIRTWLFTGLGPRSLCPEIPEGFGVGLDSLFAFDLRTLDLTPLGQGRCHQTQ